MSLLKSSSKIFTWKDFILQAFLLFNLFMVATGGAFFIRWEALKKYRDLAFVLIILQAGLAGWFAWKRHKEDSETFFDLEPVQSIKNFFEMPWQISVGILAVLFFTTQWLQQITMYQGLEMPLWDFGFYDQILWNTAHGDYLISSVHGGLSLFTEHFKPIFIFLAQLYRIFKPHAFLLLGVTDIVHASALFAFYLIARRQLQCHQTALLMVLALMFYQPWIHGIQFQYHTQVMATAFLLWAFYFASQNRFMVSLCFMITALMCKESVIVDVLGLSFYFFIKKNRLWKSTLFLGLVWLAIELLWVKPQFRYVLHHNDIWKMHDYLKHPIQNWHILWNPNPISYALQVFGPTGFLSWFTFPGQILMLPSFALRLVTPIMRNTTYHYTGGFDALVFIAMLEGFSKALTWLQKKQVKISPKGFAAALFFCVFCFSGSSQLFSIDRYLRHVTQPSIQRAIKVLDTIPSEYSVLTGERISSLLTHRKYLFAGCNTFKYSPYEKKSDDIDLIIIDSERMEGCEYEKVKRLIERGYQEIFKMDFLTVYTHPKNSLPIPEVLIQKWQSISRTEGIPYRKRIHQYYQTSVMILGCILILKSLFQRKRLSR